MWLLQIILDAAILTCCARVFRCEACMGAGCAAHLPAAALVWFWLLIDRNLIQFATAYFTIALALC